MRAWLRTNASAVKVLYGAGDLQNLLLTELVVERQRQHLRAQLFGARQAELVEADGLLVVRYRAGRDEGLDALRGQVTGELVAAVRLDDVVLVDVEERPAVRRGRPLDTRHLRELFVVDGGQGAPLCDPVRDLPQL